MKFEIIEKESFAALKVTLKKEEQIKAQAGTMLSKSSCIDVDGQLESGLLSGIGRMLAGETFFLQSLEAKEDTGEVILAPTTMGQIVELEVKKGSIWNVEKNAFFACDAGLDVSQKLQNLTRGLFSGDGFYVVKISGKGYLYLSCFGAVIKKEIKKGEEYIVDNNHLLAWNADAKIKIERAGTFWLNSFKSKEGFTTKITGPATVYLQSRNPKTFGGWLQSMHVVKK